VDKTVFSSAFAKRIRKAGLWNDATMHEQLPLPVTENSFVNCWVTSTPSLGHNWVKEHFDAATEAARKATGIDNPKMGEAPDG
jgi:hypothetical protein